MKKTLPMIAAVLITISGALASETPVSLKDAPGRAMVENLCGGCHSLDLHPHQCTVHEPANVDRRSEQDDQCLRRPHRAKRCGRAIIEYLSANYGKNKTARRPAQCKPARK
jgi:hypothetical protein